MQNVKLRSLSLLRAISTGKQQSLLHRPFYREICQRGIARGLASSVEINTLVKTFPTVGLNHLYPEVQGKAAP